MRQAKPEGARVRVFLVLFLAAAAAGLTYTFARPPIYRSEASIAVLGPGARVGVAAGQPASAAAHDTTESAVLLAEVRRLLGAPMLGAVQDALRTRLPDAAITPEALQEMLSTELVASSNVIELRAEGRPPATLPVVLQAWIDAFVAERTSRGQSEGSSERAEAEAQLRSFEQRLADKRQQLDAFRTTHDIVSLEREENEVSARIKGLNTSLAEATKKQAELQARAAAMQRDLAAGKTVLRREDRGDIAAMEKRARELREQLKEAERSYTPQYLRIDPRLRAAQENLDAIEKEMAGQRARSQREVLAEAEQDLESANRTVASLRQQLDENRSLAARFNARFAEHKALAAELEQLEALYRQTQGRLVQVELDQASRLPKVTVVAPPSLPDRHVHPSYARDAAASLAGALAVGLLGVWLTDFLRRAPARPEGPSPLIHIALPAGDRPDALLRSLPGASVGSGAALALPAAAGPARELAPGEVAALWQAADAPTRTALAGLLCGLSPQELVALQWEDLDLEEGVCHVTGHAARALPLAPAFAAALAPLAGERAGPVLVARGGAAIDAAGLAGLVAAAAYDAGLATPADVTPDALRHTYVAFLVRQGARFADLGGRVGDIPPAAFVGYGPLSPPGPGRPLDEIRQDYPLPA